MSENSSDSESSSCGWTIINHEGSDIETINSENGEPYSDLNSMEGAEFVQDLNPNAPVEQPATSSNADPVSSAETTQPMSEETQTTLEVTSSYNLSSEQEDAVTNEPVEKLSEDGVHEAVSDDSDIVTLEPPKVDEVGTLEEVEILAEELEDDGAINMSSSTSSQYTFSQLETVFPPQLIATESSNDEASDDSTPALRRRRSKRSTVSSSESDNRPPTEQPDLPPPKAHPGLGRNLNKCVLLAIVIALSMGFGHFYGTIQLQERQKQVQKIHEDELSDMKDDLFQCQKEQVATVEQKLETDDLATSLRTSDAEKKNLALENQHLRESLEKEEEALSSLQEELRKLREQIRNLEEKGRGDIMLSENQKLKAHLNDERQKVRKFRSQKETLLIEAQMLRKELDNERQNTESLKEELELISNRRSSDPTQDTLKGSEEIEYLKKRLSELEKKLRFEQQRSDLWEKLYIETKEQNEMPEARSVHGSQEKEQMKDGSGKGKKKNKDTFFNSVKDTFDAMKNSTKDFVRHHKEKIKQAKEAVKENLKKFSDSVKTTFRHFKDSAKHMFDKDRYKRYTEKRQAESKRANTVRREYKTDAHEQTTKSTTENHQEYKASQNERHADDPENVWGQTHGKKSTNKKGCSSVFECAHQESISLFNKVLDPVTVEEFRELIHTYLLEQVDNFQHWKELEQFINRFFHNGVFIHDQMLFTDFVNDVEDYLEDMKEYQTDNGGMFADLDQYIYRHFFGNAYSTPYGPSKPENDCPYKDRESYTHRKHNQKPHQHRNKREGKWHKRGRSNGYMANIEIDLGQIPFDPKY
ncbi:cell cycle progression protein 1 isoform 2-T3 [Discoglossus pictus]